MVGKLRYSNDRLTQANNGQCQLAPTSESPPVVNAARLTG